MELLDILNIISFYIGVLNLEENLSQGTAADMLGIAVNQIHKHLEEQDKKLDYILEVLNEENKKNR